MVTLQNDKITIDINPKGAELSRLYSKETNLEYLWEGNPEYWSGRSPVLFPFIGNLKHDTYFFEGKKYHLPRHGFARNMAFAQTALESNLVTFTLFSSGETLEHYPFPFQLDITHELAGNKLLVKYKVTNTGERPMYFSIGGHPAFCIPFERGTGYEDYYLAFDEIEEDGRWPLTHEGLIEALPVPYLIHSKTLALKKDMFVANALIFKHLKSRSVKLKTDLSPHGLTFSFPRFPYLGIWSTKSADFVCIEPWCGIADSVASDQQLIHKEGINMITPGQVFERTWSVEVY
jgi:galactose mutarotase-like enzyme